MLLGHRIEILHYLAGKGHYICLLYTSSSTAIYGSRASEGVILITTKGAGAGQSKAQPVEITYDGYYGIRKVARMPKFMESTEWMNYHKLSPLKQAGQQGDQGGAQHDDAAARHELLHALALYLCAIKK